jgi:adenylosuccinate synthase
VGGQKTVLHLIPSGILHPGKTCIIGNGTVVDPTVLMKEIDGLCARGLLQDPTQLLISEHAHVICPWHKHLDTLREKARGGGAIGTTGRGIGPAYEDKVARRGIRFAELLEPETFATMVRALLEDKNAYLQNEFNAQPLDAAAIIAQYRGYAERLAPHVANVSVIVDEALRKRKQLLFEGSQGTHLDIDHGTYPYVTSSNTLAGNACCGTGLGPRKITHVIGIVKAYTTRVGKGPFPTELLDKIGNRLQEKGAEFGATTGRRRRCGWLDAVILKNAVRLNGATGLAITKLDVLDGLKSLNICTHYEYQGRPLNLFPASLKVLAECRPVYETLPGWTETISGIRSFIRLPRNVKAYLRRIEELTGVPIDIISLGPDRDQTIILRNPYIRNSTRPKPKAKPSRPKRR